MAYLMQPFQLDWEKSKRKETGRRKDDDGRLVDLADPRRIIHFYYVPRWGVLRQARWA